MTPYILLGRKKLPEEDPPSSENIYDESLQLWVDKNLGVPLVSCMQNHAQPSPYGETTFTRTREGADQTEVTTIQASRFGETIQTNTREGIDQTEITAAQPTQMGETTMTKTREGVDQVEGGILPDFDAPYSHF